MRWATALRYGGTVFFRESQRAARRWQTWALRFAVSAGLFGLLTLMWRVALRDIDPVRAAEQGRTAFLVLVLGLVVTGTVIAPSLVARGLMEERDEATLDLLALTRLSPTQIVWGKVGSRLALVVLVVLGTAPALALCTTLGGTSVWEVVNGVVNALVVALVLGAIGGLAATIGIGAVPSVMGYALGAYLFLPMLYMTVLGRSSTAMGDLSPWAAVGLDGGRGLLPVFASVPVVLALIRWSGPLFSLAILKGESDVGGASAEYRAAARVRVHIGWLGLASVLLAPAALLGGLQARGTHSWAATAGLWAWVVLVQVALAGLAVLGSEWLADLRRARAPRAVGSESRPLRGHPVLWRELVAAGPRRAWIGSWSGLLVWMLLCLVLLRLGGPDFGALIGAVSGTAFTVVLTVLLSASSIAGEWHQRTLDLLAATTLRSAEIVAAKLAAVALRAGPYLVLGWSLFGAISFSEPKYPPLDAHGRVLGYACASSALTLPLAGKSALLAGWFASVWACVALSSFLAALWMPRRMNVPVASLLGVFAWLVLPFAMEGLGSSWIRDDVAILLLPIADPGTWRGVCGTSPWLIASTAAYACVAAALFGVAAASLRRAVARGDRR